MIRAKFEREKKSHLQRTDFRRTGREAGIGLEAVAEVMVLVILERSWRYY